MQLRNKHLDDLRERRNIWVDHYDPEGESHPLPTFPYHRAPEGLATRRQLAKVGLTPGRGNPPVAMLEWKHKETGRRANRAPNSGIRFAFLYDQAKCIEKKPPSLAKWRALARAENARHTCKSCGDWFEAEIPRRYGECADCHDRAKARALANLPPEPVLPELVQPEPVHLVELGWPDPKVRERQRDCEPVRELEYAS